MPRPSSWLTLPGLLRTLLVRARLGIRLLRDPAVPLLVKSIALVPLAYLVLPLDLLPDLLPLLGQLDDLGIMALSLETFISLCPPAAVAHHQHDLARGRPYTPMTSDRPPSDTGPVIDAEWRRED